MVHKIKYLKKLFTCRFSEENRATQRHSNIKNITFLEFIFSVYYNTNIINILLLTLVLSLGHIDTILDLNVSFHYKNVKYRNETFIYCKWH